MGGLIFKDDIQHVPECEGGTTPHVYIFSLYFRESHFLFTMPDTYEGTIGFS